MPWRVTFSLLSTLFSGAVLTAVICLDGGLDSPLVVLIALPVLSAALALPIRGVWICGVAALVEFAIVMLANFDVAVSRSEIAATAAFLVGAVVLSLGAAVSAHAWSKTKSGSSWSSTAKHASTPSPVA